MCTWKRQPQQCKGTYLFSGQLYVTRGVAAELHREEILLIYQDVRTFAEQQGGIDYLQVYEDKEGRRLFFIDQLSKLQLESGQYQNEHNYATLLFPSEY